MIFINTIMNRLFGINHIKNICNENKLKTVLPLSVIKYAIQKEMYIPYISYDQNNNTFNVDNILNSIQKAELVSSFDGKIITEHKLKDDNFINFPPHDIFINNKDYESKLCVFPCHNKSKLFELIIRQNNIACCIQNIVRSNKNISCITDNFHQQPYILICLYDNFGLKPMIVSNKALIYMCIESSKTKSRRAHIICEAIYSMITEYKVNKSITYKKEKEDTVPHQKTTIYIYDHIHNIKQFIDNTQYIPYDQIISGQVQKTRNICDFINDFIIEKELKVLQEENRQLRSYLNKIKK